MNVKVVVYDEASHLGVHKMDIRNDTDNVMNKHLRHSSI